MTFCKGLFVWSWGNPDRWGNMRRVTHPTYDVNVIKLKWDIIWTGGCPPPPSGLPHLPGVPHPCVNRPLDSHRSYRLRQRSHLIPGHGARVRFLLGTNVNTLFFQVTKLHWIQVLVCRPSLLVLGQSTALFSLLCSCLKMASNRAKWSSYVHSCLCRIIRYSKCEHNTMDFVPVPRHWFPGIKCGKPLRLINLSLL